MTDLLRRMLVEGDGEGARVVIRALDELAELVAPLATVMKAAIQWFATDHRAKRLAFVSADAGIASS